MKPADFRRIALALDGAEEGEHMGVPDFRVGGRIFATLAHEAEGYGNLMLTPDTQAPLVEELPDVFIPVKGGWGRMGSTHVRLAVVDEEVLEGALTTAWKLRLAKSTKKKKAAPPAAKKKPAALLKKAPVAKKKKR
jgi:hypothetical protein